MDTVPDASTDGNSVFAEQGQGIVLADEGDIQKRQGEYRGGAGPRLLVKLEGETQADALLLHRLRLRLRGRGGGRGRLLDRQGRGLLGILVYNLLDVVLRGAAAASDWAIEWKATRLTEMFSTTCFGCWITIVLRSVICAGPLG